MFNRKVRLIITVALSTALLLSGCGSSTAELFDETILESTVLQTSAETTTTAEATTEATTAAITATTTKTTTETTTETKTETEAEIETTQERELTPEEVNLMNDMPEIVFVLSHSYWSSSKDEYSNIRGFYITKNGEVKMYAFSDEEESKYTDIIEVYDELENVTCSDMIFRAEGDKITQDDLNTVPISDLIELYKKLLLVDNESKIKEEENAADAVYGHYELYGIRANQNSEKEFILLDGWGESFLINEDINAQEISNEIRSSIYPFSYYSMMS